MADKTVRNILVVSDPPAAPGYLPRVRFICDYLVHEGYSVTLLTEAYQPLDFAHSYPIVAIPMYNGRTTDWAVKTVWTLLSDWHNRVFARRAQKALDGQRFDVVLCSAFSDFPLGAARRLAEAYSVPLVCDIRDLDEQVEDSRYQYHHQTWWTMPFRRLYRAIHIRRRNAVLRAANAVTTISPWHRDFIRQFNPNVHLVYNGFDDAQFFPKDIRTERFTITYIGSLFEWQQASLSLVKRIVDDLGLDIVLDIHTPKQNTLAHNALGDAIRKSGIMLVLTNPKTHGMLTTKFYEALGCAKPILCVPSDEGALAELMQYTHAGLATNDEEQIKAFIVARYQEWQQHGYTRQAVAHREDFARAAQCRKLLTILQQIAG